MGAGVVTPEAVVLELPVAGVAARVFARLVDLVLQLVVAVALSFASTFVLTTSISPVLVVITLSFTVLVVLPIGTEVLWRGRSPGKAMFGLRVVGVDGAPETPRQAVVRGLVALVDLYLSVGAVALVGALSSPAVQRPGDLAAGTVVIRSRPAGRTDSPIAFLPPAGYEAYVASLDVGALDDEDFSLLRETLLRVTELTAPHRQRVTRELAEAVAARIRHRPPWPIDPELWLVCVASAYQFRAGGLLADAAAGLAPVAPVAARPATARR